MRRTVLAAVVAVTLSSLPAAASGAVSQAAAPPPAPAVSLSSAGPYAPGTDLRLSVTGSTSVVLVWGSATGDFLYGHGSGDGSATVRLHARDHGGRWRLEEIITTEGSWGGQYHVYERDGDVRDAGSSRRSARHSGDFSLGDFDLANDSVDRVPPRLTSIPTGTVRVRPGDAFALEYGVWDDRSEALEIYPGYYGKSISTFFGFISRLETMERTPEGARLVARVDARTEPGPYTLEHVYLRDSAGNGIGYAGDGRVYPGSAGGSPDRHDLPLTSLVVVVDPDAPAAATPVEADGPRRGPGAPVSGPPAAALDLVPGPTTPAYGALVVLTGRAKDTSGAPAVNAPVTVHGRRPGGPEVPLATTHTDADGDWRYAFAPYSGMSLRASSGPATTPSTDLVLTPQVELRAAAAPATARTAYSITASAAPARPGATLTLERLLPTGTWLPVATGSQDALGRARFERTELLAGPVTYRAVLAPAPGYAGASGTAVVDVR